MANCFDNDLYLYFCDATDDPDPDDAVFFLLARDGGETLEGVLTLADGVDADGFAAHATAIARALGKPEGAYLLPPRIELARGRRPGCAAALVVEASGGLRFAPYLGDEARGGIAMAFMLAALLTEQGDYVRAGR